MVAMYRQPNLEVTVTPHPLLFWEWQVQDDGDLFNSGFSSTRWKARYDGNAALFEVLSGGFYSEPLFD